MATESKLPELYCEGLELSLNSTHPDHQIDIAAGCCRCSSDCDDIVSDATITVDIEDAGANGLDAGAEAASTLYYVWLIHDIDTPTVAGLLSTSDSAPTLPGGYTYKKLLGFVRNNASEDFEEPNSEDLDMHDKDIVNLRDIKPKDNTHNVTFESDTDGTVNIKNTGSQAGFGDDDIDNHSDHLTAYWKMEATGAAARVDSVGSNDLTAINTPATRAGVSNNACDFIPGSSQGLSRADTADISPTTGMAISLWLYADDISAERQIIQKINSYLFITVPTASKFYWQIHEGGGTAKNVVGVTITTGSWHHVVLMACDGFVRVFVDNNEPVAATAYNDTLKDDTDTLYFGQNAGAGAYWDGGIDEVGFWKNISFADQTEREAFVAALYNSGSGRFYSATVVGGANLDVQSKFTAAESKLGGVGATADEFSTDGTLAGDSDTAVPTEKAVKTYVDTTCKTKRFWIPTTYQQAGGVSAVMGNPLGALVDAAAEFGQAVGAMPDDLTTVAKVIFYGSAAGADVDGMMALITAYFGPPGSSWVTGTAEVTKNNEEADVAVNDVVTWELTGSDDVDLANIVAGDLVAFRLTYAAADGDYIATNTRYSGVLVEYT